jgi:hypothetical protein
MKIISQQVLIPRRSSWHPHCVDNGYRLSSRGCKMTAIVDSKEIDIETGATERDGGAGLVEESAVDNDKRQNESSYGNLPWIGALPNPQVGPMVVLNENGYLIPLCTASDLLRGCRYFWHTL